MAKNLIKLVCVIGYWVCTIYIGAKYGFHAGAVVLLALLLQAFDAAVKIYELENEDDEDSDSVDGSCDDVKHHIDDGGFRDE